MEILSTGFGGNGLLLDFFFFDVFFVGHESLHRFSGVRGLLFREDLILEHHSPFGLEEYTTAKKGGQEG